MARIWQPETQQQLFRQLLWAMSLPGTIVDLTPYLAGDRASLGILATLVDSSVTLSDPDTLLDSSMWYLLQARRDHAEVAQYVLCDATVPPRCDFTPCLGTLIQPDHGATLLLRGERLGQGRLRVTLAGPGVRDGATVALQGFHPLWFERRALWVAHFPLGVDCLLTDATHVVALPRTTTVRLEA